VPRRRLTAVLVACGLVAGAGLGVASASGAAGLSVRNRLVWERPDGTRLAVRPEVRVRCGPWASDVAVPSIHVFVGGRSSRRPSAWWELHAVVADVQRRPVVRLPNSFNFDEPKGAQLFAVDRRNELNSDQEESSGSIRFGRVACGPALRISFRVRGRVGSELFDGETLRVRGSFSASATS
jgi:hypothetical protein